MTKITQAIRNRRLHVSLFAIFVLVNVQAHALNEKGTNMSASAKNIWQTVSTLESQMPLSKVKVEEVLGIHLDEIRRDEFFLRFKGKGQVLAEGISITDVSLMIRPSMEFDEKSGFAMELAGSCVTLDEIQKRYGKLEIVQHPRGRSLQETAVWAAQRDWGTLNFAFKQDKPDCLFRISLSK